MADPQQSDFGVTGMIAAPTAQPTSGRAPIALDVDGKHVLLPLQGDFNDDKAVQTAISTYHQTGQHWGVFDNLNDARAYGQQLSTWQGPAAQTPGPAPQQNQPPPPPAAQIAAPPLNTGPLGGVVQGATDLAGGFYDMQPVHPSQTGQMASQIAGPVGLAVHDAVTQGSNPQQFAATATSGLRDVASNTGMAQGNLQVQALDAISHGDYLTGARKFVDYMIPFFGPMLDKASDDAARGQIMKSIGETLGIAVNLLPFSHSGAVADAVSGTRLAPGGALPADTPMLGRTAAGPVLPDGPAPVLQSEVNSPFPTGSSRLSPGYQQPRGVQIVPGNQRMPGVGISAGVPGALLPSQQTGVASFADQNQIPIDLATRTGSDAIRGLKDLNTKTGILSQWIDRRMMQKYVTRIQAVGAKLASLVYQGDDISAIGGGEKAIDVLQRLKRAYHAQADAAYGQARQIAKDAAGGAVVPYGSVPIEMPVHIGSALADIAKLRADLAKRWFIGRDGIMLSQAKAKAIAAIDSILEAPGVVPAVDLDGWLSNLKAAARGMDKGPINAVIGKLEGALNEMLSGDSVKGLTVERDAVHAAAVKQGDIVDAAIKYCIQCRTEASLRDNGELTQGAGGALWSESVNADPVVAAQQKIIDAEKAKLDVLETREYSLTKEIASASGASPEERVAFTKALMDGRAVTRQKYDIVSILNRLAGSAKTASGDVLRDPNRLVRRLTATRDAHIQDLRELQRVAPEAIPPVARGVLQQMLDKAFHEPGKFDHAAALYGEWGRMGAETKRLLFGARANDITQFFRLATEMSRVANSSNSGNVVALGEKGLGTAALLLHSPLAGIISIPLMEAGQAQLARVLWSPNGAALLAKAMKTPVKSASGASVGAQVVNTMRAVGVAVKAADKTPTAAPVPAAAQQPPPPQQQTQRAPVAPQEMSMLGFPSAPARPVPHDIDLPAQEPQKIGPWLVREIVQPTTPGQPRTHPPELQIGSWRDSARKNPKLRRAVEEIGGADAYDTDIPGPVIGGVEDTKQNLGLMIERMLIAGKTPGEITRAIFGSRGTNVELR